MGSLVTRAQRVIILLLLAIFGVLTVVYFRRDKLYVDTSYRILNTVSESIEYEVISVNECIGGLDVYSNILINMQGDGWKLDTVEYFEDGVDSILKKDSVICRVILSSNHIVSLASPYAESYVPMLYIEVGDSIDR